MRIKAPWLLSGFLAVGLGIAVLFALWQAVVSLRGSMAPAPDPVHQWSASEAEALVRQAIFGSGFPSPSCSASGDGNDSEWTVSCRSSTGVQCDFRVYENTKAISPVEPNCAVFLKPRFQ